MPDLSAASDLTQLGRAWLQLLRRDHGYRPMFAAADDTRFWYNASTDQGCVIMSNATRLDDIVSELSTSDRQERIDILLDFAKTLPALPERLLAHKDASHRVEECQSPVYLFAEMDGDRVMLYADAPIEAPTVRGFVAILVDGLSGSSVEDVLNVPTDLVERSGLGEILGMLRVRGLSGVLRRFKAEVTRVAIKRATASQSSA